MHDLVKQELQNNAKAIGEELANSVNVNQTADEKLPWIATSAISISVNISVQIVLNILDELGVIELLDDPQLKLRLTTLLNRH